MTLIPLHYLMTEGRAADHPVAWRNGALIEFGRFRDDVAKTASKFKACKEAVLICQDSYNFAVGFLGLLHAGAQIILPPHTQTTVRQAFHADSGVVIDDPDIADNSYEAASLTSLDPQASSLLFYTSGSTGGPKAVRRNLAMLEGEIAILDQIWGDAVKSSSVFATVPHQHVYGLTFKLLWPLMAGRPFAADRHALWENLVADIKPHVVIISSPAHLERLEAIAPLPQERQPARIFSAGASLSFEAVHQTEKIFGCRPTEIFGSTETGAFATRQQTEADALWQILPTLSMQQSADGRLMLCAPSIGPDWVTTDDLVEVSGQGLRFLGRADRIVKVEGKRVHLTEVEQALQQLPFVKEAAVLMLTGTPSRLAAAIVPSEEGAEALGKMGTFRFSRLLRSHLGITQDSAAIPRTWRFVDELPIQGMGKRRDADIRALFGDAV